MSWFFFCWFLLAGIYALPVLYSRLKLKFLLRMLVQISPPEFILEVLRILTLGRRSVFDCGATVICANQTPSPK
jgi:hypothetical protein